MMPLGTKTFIEMTNVTLIDSMGTDLSVVNAARVSFNKKSNWGHHVPGQGIYCDTGMYAVLAQCDFLTVTGTFT